MRRYRVFPEDTSFYYSTCTIIAWLPIFQSEAYFNIIIDSLSYCRLHKGLYLLGFVIMPTHIHLITSNREDTNLSAIIRDFRAHTARKIRDQLNLDCRKSYLQIFELAAKDLPDQQFKIWKDDFHPVVLTSEQWFNQKMDYLHYNPVRKGFVELPEHWKYSSARNWLLDDNSVITLDKHILYGEG